MQNTMRSMLVTLLVLVVYANPARAQHEWSGGGGDDLWSSAANWTNAAAPVTNYTGKITFGAADVGNSNVLDADRAISGSASHLSYGLHYNLNAADIGAGHTTDLNGRTLALDGGTLQVGYNASNSVVVITNGTLQLGGATALSVIISQNPNALASLLDFTGNYCTVSCDVDVQNLGTITVGYNSAGNARSAQGTLDFSGATIASGGTAHALVLGSHLWVARNSGSSSGPGTWGRMLLPPTLESLEVQDLIVGYNRSLWGELDFGAGSSLTNLTIRGDFYISDSASKGYLLNLPTGVVVRVGSPGSPKRMHISYVQYVSGTFPGTFVLTNGMFIGYLSELYIGYQPGGNSMNPDGLVDLQTCEVQIGNTPNMIDIPILSIGSRGGEGSATVLGELRIPASITNITAGKLQLGYQLYGDGTLDIGADSQLRDIAISTGYYLGGGQGRIGHDPGTGFEEYLPAGINVTIGQAGAPAELYLSRRNAHPSRGGNGFAELKITNGTFTGHISTLLAGVQIQTPSAVRTTVGKLDLTNATVNALQIGDAYVGSWTATGNKYGSGYLYLPAATVGITNLYLGDTEATSLGWVELFGTVVEIGNVLSIEPTGVVTNHMGAAPGGIDMLSGDTNDLIVATGGQIHLALEADPANAAISHWGIRMPGDVRPHFEALAADGRLTWSTDGLSPALAAMAGVHYDGVYTYAGVPPTASPPTVENRPATNVTLLSANLNGYLVSTGSAPVTVSVYWGDADGGDVASGDWQHTNAFSEGAWLQGEFPTAGVSLGASNTFYYYRYAAANAGGTHSPASSTYLMAADVWVTAPDASADESGPDTGTFTVHRVSGVIAEPVTVHYTMAGTAVDGDDYSLSPSGSNVTIQAGETEAAITLTPNDNPYPESAETALLVLTPGAYAIGAPASDTVTIEDAGGSTNTSATDVGPWVGIGLDDLWSTAANWASNASPALSFTGTFAFTTVDLGNVNVVETNRSVNGPAQNVAYGLRYNLNASDATSGHTTDLDGHALTVNGGALEVGYIASNSVVTLTNGTLVLGGAAKTDVLVGSRPAGLTPPTTKGNVLTVSAAVNAANLGHVYVGRAITGNGPGAHGRLDLSASTIDSGARGDTLKLNGDLRIGQATGWASGATTEGTVSLPTALRALEVDGLSVGHGRAADGTLDFGAGSQLTNLTVNGDFYLSSDSGLGRILNLPAGVAWRVGTPGAPGTMRIGHYQYAPSVTVVGVLGITNGSFVANLANLTVGLHRGGNLGAVDALLDLSATTVRSGSEADRLDVGTLLVGGKNLTVIAQGGAWNRGIVKLPGVVTNLTVGSLSIGVGNNSRGRLDIGANSQLATFTVSDGFYLGDDAGIGHDGGTGFVDYLPAGINVAIGSSNRYAAVDLGRRVASQYPSYGEIYANGSGKLVVTSGVFSAYISDLHVGVKEPSTKTVTGVLDVASCTLSALQISNAWVGAEFGLRYGSFTEDSDNQNGKGYVYLPDAEVNIVSNLYVGDTHATSLGLIELFGTTVTIGGKLDMNATGVITNHVGSVEGGIDLLSTDTNDFAVAAGGEVHVDFGASRGLWGLRMAGDQVTHFESLVADGRLTWSASHSFEPVVVFDGTHTVYRVPLPQGTMIIMR